MAAPKGNKYNEKWTIKASQELFDKALELAKGGAITLTDIANELDVYTDVFEYICNKHEDFRPVKKRILSQIENNTYKGALNGDYIPSVAIFGLKNNHGWKDKQEITQDINVKNDVSTMTTEELLLRAKATKEVE